MASKPALAGWKMLGLRCTQVHEVEVQEASSYRPSPRAAGHMMGKGVEHTEGMADAKAQRPGRVEAAESFFNIIRT